MSKGISKGIQPKGIFVKKVLKWVKENPGKTEKMTIAGIFKAARGRYPCGNERKILEESLKKKKIPFSCQFKRKLGQNGLTNTEKVLKYIDGNLEETEKKTISAIFKKVIGRRLSNTENKDIQEALNKKGIKYKKRFSLKETLKEKGKREKAEQKPLSFKEIKKEVSKWISENKDKVVKMLPYEIFKIAIGRIPNIKEADILTNIRIEKKAIIKNLERKKEEAQPSFKNRPPQSIRAESRVESPIGPAELPQIEKTLEEKNAFKRIAEECKIAKDQGPDSTWQYLCEIKKRYVSYWDNCRGCEYK